MSNRTTFRFIHPINVPGQSDWMQMLEVDEDAWKDTGSGVAIYTPDGRVFVPDHNIVCITTEEQK